MCQCKPLAIKVAEFSDRQEANREMGTGEGDVDMGVPMLVVDQQLTVGGRPVCTDGCGLDRELPTYVLCPISEKVEEYEEEQATGRQRDDPGP